MLADGLIFGSASSTVRMCSGVSRSASVPSSAAHRALLMFGSPVSTSVITLSTSASARCGSRRVRASALLVASGILRAWCMDRSTGQAPVLASRNSSHGENLAAMLLSEAVMSAYCRQSAADSPCAAS